jgi:hypothetical protein
MVTIPRVCHIAVEGSLSQTFGSAKVRVESLRVDRVISKPLTSSRPAAPKAHSLATSCVSRSVRIRIATVPTLKFSGTIQIRPDLWIGHQRRHIGSG